MARYRTINVDLNRQYRNDLNANFAQIEDDIKSQEGITAETKAVLLAELARVERESKERDDALAKQNLETLLQSIEDAKSNANTAAASATTQAGYAKTQGDYAKTQGDYAKGQGDYANLKGDYANEKAIEADTAAGRANQEATGLESLKVAVVDATQSANTAAGNAGNQAAYAKTQGDYAKEQGDRAREVADTAPVVSVNGKKGVVSLTATDVEAVPTSEKGVAGGVAKLNDAGKVVDATGNEVEGKVTSVNGQVGDVLIPEFSGDYADLTGTPTLKPVATTGSYNDLTNKPTIPAPVTLNNTVTSTSTTQAATANAVKVAYDKALQAFQQANDGKTAIANAVTAKGVSASPADTFAALAGKIGQIPTGKRIATGSVITTTDKITVSGLAFKPSIVIAQFAFSILPDWSKEKFAVFYDGGKNQSSLIRTLDFYMFNTSSPNYNAGHVINSGSFTLKVIDSSDGVQREFVWIAVE